MEQKIFLEKEDDLEKAVGHLTSSPAERIVLNIPKNSVLGASVHNFQVLEREGMTAGKELAIESVDEHILELASLATIPAVNPVFKVREVAVADIVPRVEKKKEKKEEKEETEIKKEKAVKKTRAKAVRKPVTDKKLSTRKKKEVKEEIKQDIQEPELKREHELEKKLERELENGCEPEPKKIFEHVKKPKKNLRPKLISLAIVGAVIIVGYFAVTVFLPKADINASIQKTTVTFSSQVSVDTSVNSPSADGKIIILPGQLSVAKNNLSMNFLATGSSTVSTKASGIIIIHNDYTQNQTLVATTRFESPDGKIFRIIKQTTIPKGKSVETQVIADKPGSDYNVPPSQNWQIPGFKGKPQYGKIYGESKSSMTGGASGNQIVPSADDIKNAKLEIETALSSNLKSQTLLLSSESLRLLDNASVFNITNETISGQVDKDNNFNIFAAGELRQLVFDEAMLKDVIMQSAASTSTASLKINEFTINYGTSTVDFIAGKMSFSINGQVVYEPKIDFDAFKNEILGKDADTLKTMLFALPGLQKANISLWPFWVNSVPTRASRVNISVE